MKIFTIENIDIEVYKKNVKNINLSVRAPEGKVRVSAPKSISDEVLKKFILSKLPWIKKQQARISSYPIQPEYKIISDQYIFLGKKVFYSGNKF